MTTSADMDAITALLTLLALTLVVLAHACQRRRRAGAAAHIPGPWSYPLIGTLSVSPPKIHLQFTDWAKRYGDVFAISILGQRTVVLNSYDTIREALFSRSASFNHRPALDRAQRLMLADGVGFQPSDEHHKTLRKTGLRALRPGVEWIAHLEHVVGDHLSELLDIFEAKAGEPFNPRRLTHQFLDKIILTLLFGERFYHDDPILDELERFNESAMRAMAVGREHHDFFPTLARLLDPAYRDVERAIELRRQVVEPLYRRHKETYEAGKERGIMDYVIADVHNKLITDDNAVGVLLDYLIAGVETTATVVQGLMLMLLCDADLQARLQSEVDTVVGRDRSPSLADRSKMPYTEATILELLRYQTPIPILLPYVTSQDTQVGGYAVPKGTWVLANAWAVNHNESLYEQPYCFKPERFLDAESGELLPCSHPLRKNVLSFGLGSRHCPGEALAKNRLFLTVTSMMQRFTFVPDASCPPPTNDARQYKLRIIFDVGDYKLRAVRRV